MTSEVVWGKVESWRLKQVSLAEWWIRSHYSDLGIDTGHRYGNFAVVPQTSFRRDFPMVESRNVGCFLRMPCLFHNRPGRLLNFWTLRPWDWVLIRGWALTKFSPFSASVVCLFSNKTINGCKKTRRCSKARFCNCTLKKTPSSGQSVISTYSISISVTLSLKSISEYSVAA